MGLLDDARRSQQQAMAARVSASDGLQRLAQRQTREIGEFIEAMKELGIPPVAYTCTYQRQSYFMNGPNFEWLTKTTSETVTGWHIGPWTKSEVAGQRPAKRGRPQDGYPDYWVVTPGGEVRQTRVQKRSARTQPFLLPYIDRSSYNGEEFPERLSDMLREALRTILAGGRD
ncbi:hypothetical protein IU450_34100 [Nocardia abscessus]|uniref:hypothetical protein n=1 Tax=Nocardia abscessus TaxID=120957 RepID=UPI00189471E5|nr:hypothetical protein [Nocardia abscessus]MBF6340886.1 hypothetical protein [Nocardia abscessus]